MTDSLLAIERFSSWRREAALPLWTRNSWDARHGGFFEALDFTGAPLRGPRRVRVQSRQVYTFSEVDRLGWSPEASDLAADGFDYLVDRACADEAARGCVHVLTDEGAVADATRDLYDQAFLLLACAGRIRSANCRRARRIAARTMDFLDRELASPHGGWIENPDAVAPRRQNPHMHLLEAFMALYRATGDARWRDNAARVVDLFETRFFEPSSGALLEFFSDDWRAPDPDKGDRLEPGHMMEWIWLLGHYDNLFSADHRAAQHALYAKAQSYQEGDGGFLPDTDAPGDGAETRRLWPQTEYIKAAFILSRALDDDYARDGARIINMAFASYLKQPVAGLWCDQYSAGGAPLAKDVPASILYHLHEALVESLRFADRMSAA